MGKDRIQLSEEERDALVELREIEKFREDMTTFYPGAESEELIDPYERHINDLISSLLQNLEGEDRKTAVLSEFRRTFQHFEEADTEDRDRVCDYLEEIMDILGIESSDGLLNTWLYGFDPNDVRARSQVNTRKDKILWVDCLGALIVGVIVLLIHERLGEWTGLPAVTVIAMGAANLLYGVYSLIVTTRDPRPLSLVGILAFANMAWLLVCIGIVAANWPRIEPFGVFSVLGEGVYVAVLGFTEWRWRRWLADDVVPGT